MSEKQDSPQDVLEQWKQEVVDPVAGGNILDIWAVGDDTEWESWAYRLAAALEATERQLAAHLKNEGDECPLCAAERRIEELENPDPCIWTYQDHFGYYETACDADWQFVDGGMKGNDVYFCMNCGRPAKEANPEPQSEAEEDDG